MNRTARWSQVGLDLLAVLVFVVIGRSAHAHQLTASGIASTTWPFTSGLALAWSVLVLRLRNGASLPGGLWVATCTVAVGMILRVIAGQGTAVAFVFVAIGFLLATMWAWRIVFAVVHARSA